MIKHIIFDAFGTLFQVEKGASANAVLKHLNAFGHHPDADAFHAEWKSFYRKHTASFPFQTEREIFTARIRHFCEQYQVPGNAEKAALICLQLPESVRHIRMPNPFWMR